jgi:choline/glycine/proline betaine transport protein
MDEVDDQQKRPVVERERFGGTDRSPSRRQNETADRPPISSEEMQRGRTDLAQHAGPRVNWRVFLTASLVIVAFSLWAMLTPDTAQTTMKAAVDWIAENVGWFYVVTVTAVILFVLWVALSKEGTVRLGPDHSRPQYNLFTWVAMLFAAGVGIAMLFYSVTGPITQYLMPVNADPESAAAAQDAVVWTMFHYGIAGWSMYSLLGMAMGYFAYRWGMPLSIRAALYPLLGKRVRGATGDVIDIVALVGTVFGVATSMGIGVVLLNVGFSWLFGLPQGLGLQIALVVVAVVMTIAACTSGVDKGIRIISELNLWSTAAMMVYILVTGQTAFLLNALVENIGRFIFSLPERTLQTMVYQEGGSEWMGGWTLFFWAFWLAWGPFVGLFLARISRGRTLREFVLAAITAPVLCDFIIVSIFGNSALARVFAGDTDFAQLAIDSPESGWYALLEQFPGAAFLIGLATLSGLLFYLTSANSGAMVMSNFSSSIPDPADDGAKWLRIFWAVLTALLTIAMLVAGGVSRHGVVLEGAADGAGGARGTRPPSPRPGRARRSGAGEDLATEARPDALVPVREVRRAVPHGGRPARARDRRVRVPHAGRPGRPHPRDQRGDRTDGLRAAGRHGRAPQLPLSGHRRRVSRPHLWCAQRGPRRRRLLPDRGLHAHRFRGLRPPGPQPAADHRRRAGPLRDAPVVPRLLQ